MIHRSPIASFRLAALVCACSAVTLACAAETPGAAESETKQTPFVSTVMSHFGSWDADADGELESPELDAAVADPANTGDVAAAAASLRMLSRNAAKTGPLPALTKAYFEAYNAKAVKSVHAESAAAAENATLDPGTERAAGETKSAEADNKSNTPNWDRYFLAGKARIAKGGNSKAWPEQFTLASMKQGPLGDCFFIATVGSMVMRSPDRIHQIITPLEDGQYRVTFPNTESFTIEPVTDGYRAMSSTTADEGAWMAVLEQAYGKFRSKARGGSLDVDGTNVLRVGGDSSVVIMQLTGHAYERISFGKTLEQREAKSAEVLPKLRAAIKENIAAGRLITCGILPPAANSVVAPGTPGATTQPAEKVGTLPSFPAGIVKKHVYAVVSYDEATDTLELWNPHSNTFTPKGEPGLKNGYVTQGGKFKLPLTEAYKFYTSFTFETAEPAKKRD